MARTWFSLGFFRAAYVSEAYAVLIPVLSEQQQRDSVAWQLVLNFGRLLAFVFVAACCMTSLERLGELPGLGNSEIFHMYQCDSGTAQGEWMVQVRLRWVATPHAHGCLWE